MKRKRLVVLLTLICSAMNAFCMNDASERVTIGNNNESNKSLVVYFSCTNTTKGVAEKIADIVGGDIYRIVPETPYTSADLDYNIASSRANLEQNDPSSRPVINGKVENIEDYDIVFIGYPIWWGKAPQIIYTFLESYDLSGKTVVPFCTSGSSGLGTSDKDLHSSAPKAQWKAGRKFDARSSKKDIESWLRSQSVVE